jgi:hypothetical protein
MGSTGKVTSKQNVPEPNGATATVPASGVNTVAGAPHPAPANPATVQEYVTLCGVWFQTVAQTRTGLGQVARTEGT